MCTERKDFSNLCYTCSREQKGFGKDVRDDFRVIAVRRYCSLHCMRVDMDWTTREQEAMRAGAKQFGVYVEGISKGSAFASWTEKEFMTALECYTKGYHDSLANNVFTPQAMRNGVAQMSEYIESIGKSDVFMALTAQQAMNAIECYTSEYHNFLSSGKVLDDAIPF